MENTNPIQVADRLFGAIELLATNGSLSLTEISHRLALNKSTAHRVLSSLIYMGYVRQGEDSGKYSLTLKITELSNALMSKIDIVHMVRPHLRRLMELTQETVHFVERDGTEAVYIDKVEAYTNTVQMVSRIGSRIPLYRSGVGKAIAAEMSDPEVRELWEQSKIVRTTPYTITDFDDFIRNLEEVRSRGYALDNEENEAGVRCIAVSLPVHQQRARYAFSISAPVGRMDNDRIRQLAEYVLDARKQIMGGGTARQQYAEGGAARQQFAGGGADAAHSHL